MSQDEPSVRTLVTRDLSEVPAIAQRVVERYGYSRDAALTLFPFTENWTFRVDDGNRAPAVLRVYRPGGRPLVEVHSELAWMVAVGAEAGVHVPRVRPTVDGGTVVETVDATTGMRCFCVAYEVAPGHEPREDQLRDWFPTLGAITARLHKQARGWEPPPWFRRPRWDVDTMLGDHPHWGPWHRSVGDSEERRQLETLADVVARRLERFGTSPERFGLVHADLRLANLMVDEDRTTLIDFDDCGFSWYLYDLACALTFNEIRADLDELVSGWVAAYRQIEPLSDEDEREIRTFIMLRRLMLSAYAGLRPDTDLAREMHEMRFAAQTCVLAEPYLAEFG